MYKKSILFILTVLILSQVFAQGPFIRKFEIQPNQRISITGKSTAIVFLTKENLGNTISLTINGKEQVIPLDPDAPEYSYFKSLDGVQTIESLSSQYSGAIHLINSGVTPTIKSSSKQASEECQFELDPILQEEWRAGLPEPDYTRSFTDVEHVIVHHSAGSNTATDYTQVVRDIYIYHTESHGWSDIGYNYLIAQNGDLYAGRDPDTGEQDNVLGAHFCGSNSTTMGICLLGNYETAEPAEALWNTLTLVASFKMQKEDLDPLTSSTHPLGLIGHIAGHRDGCNTLCPGENVYNKLEELRYKVQQELRGCDTLLSVSITPNQIEPGDEVTFTNLSGGYSSYTWILEGASPNEANWEVQGTAIYSTEGSFDVKIIGYQNEISDTLILEAAVIVAEKELDFSTSKEELWTGEEIQFTNQSYGYDSYQWILNGASPSTADWQTSGTASYDIAGNYDVQLIGYYGDYSDTLLIKDLVSVSERLLSIAMSSKTIDLNQSIVFTNLSEGYDSHEWLFEGGSPSSANWDDEGTVTYTYGGNFDVQLIGSYGEEKDTLTYSESIVVEGELSIFPNPIDPMSTITIATSKEIDEISIIGIDGKVYFKDSSIENNQVQIPTLRQGMYLLNIRTNSGLEKRKLLIL